MTGNFTGTTDEIIQWVACNRGIDENLIRAEATLESYWVQSTQGDFANGKYHSFGLMQVSHDDANGNLLKGGYPNTMQDTALDVDYYGSEMRACFERDAGEGRHVGLRRLLVLGQLVRRRRQPVHRQREELLQHQALDRLGLSR